MKCMIIRKADPDTEAGKMPGQELLMAMGKYNERMVDAGVFVDGAGLKPSVHGARIKFSQGKPVVTDGPFAESKEILAGFTIIETATFEEALDWVKQWPPEDDNGGLELELRRFYDMDDFPPGEGLDVHKDYAERLARQPSGVTTYLRFGNGKCREALEFYAQSLGGKVTEVVTWGDMGVPDLPEERQGQVAHATLKIGKWSIAGVDNTPEEAQGSQPGSIILMFPTPEKTEAAFKALVEGGTATLTPQATAWSPCFAMLTDRYGVAWLLNCDQPAAN